MAEYTKKTVAELQEVLKSRGLSASGKKADLIARLNEADKQAETETADEPAPGIETEEATTKPVDAPAPEPAADVPNTQDNENTEAPPNATTEEAPAVEAENYALNLSGTDVDDEMAKRKARAERFKTNSDAPVEGEASEEATTDSEALKKLERSKRFGDTQSGVSKLDEALPPDGPRGRRGGKRHPDDAQGNRRGRGFDKRRRGGPGKPTGVSKPAAAYTSKGDRDAAEARKKRFTAAT